MKENRMKFRILSSLISVIVIIALVLTIAMTFDILEKDNASADAILVSDFTSSDGILYDSSNNKVSAAGENSYYVLGSDSKYHMTSAGYNAAYSGYTITEISSGSGLKSFIETCSSSSYATNVGVLTQDITYNMTDLGIVSSTAVFYGIFDGNAYNVTMVSAAANSTISYNSSFTGILGEFTTSPFSGYYYTGMICAVNEGTIKNCNFDWQSALSISTTLSGNGAVLKNSSYSSYYLGVSGTICGLLYNGNITNCNVTLTGTFAIAQSSTGNKNTDMCYNSCIVGGICGYIAANGTLERTTLNNNGGVLALADGSKDNIYTKKASSVAGGLAGGIKPADSTAKVVNCSLTGAGSVIGMCGQDADNDRNNDGMYGYAGGAIGATYIITGKNSATCTSINSDQIDGIVSSWTGKRINIWGDSPSSAETKTIAGCLFDAIGEDSEITLNNCVVLYDYIGYVAANGSTYTTLDSHCAIAYGEWTEIYAASAYGTVSVTYDYSKPANPIRVEAVAEDFFDNYTGSGTISDVVTSTKNFSLSDTTKKLGKFIWQCTFCDTVRAEASGYNIVASDQIGAQIFLVSASRKGSISYTFGEKVSLSFSNNNTSGNTNNYLTDYSKYYNGELIRNPSVILTRSNNETTSTNNSCFTFAKKYTVLNGYDETSYVYTVTDDSLLYLPGLYTYTSNTTVTEPNDTESTFGYYDATNYIFADYDSTLTYEYAIYAGTSSQFVASATSSSTDWKEQDVITIGYYTESGYVANLIDYYTYSIGNGTPTSKISMADDAATVGINVTDTGKYTYNFTAYLDNPYEIDTTTYADARYLTIATTSVQTFVDTEAPEIKNIKYYEYDEDAADHKGIELSSSDLEDWLTTNVLVVYTVTDNNLSGINSGSGQTTSNKVNDTRWECTVVLNGTTSSQLVTYVDEVGNSVSKTFSAFIDTTKTSLEDVITLNYSEYLVYYAQLGYCPTDVEISFTPIFGASGAYLQYSYEKDEHNEDIWVRYDKTLVSDQPNSFTLNFDMENCTFKMRLVSEEGIYATSYANGDGYVTNGASDTEESIHWTIKIVIAYIGITLDNLFYDSTALSGQDLNALFAKTYDATTESQKTVSIQLYSSGTTAMAKTSIIYSELYSYSPPAIDIDSLLVVITYASKDVGNRKVSITVSSVGDYEGKYLVYFTDGSIFTDYSLLTQEDAEYDDITSAISKVTLNVDLADYTDQFKTQYTYGETIPSTIVVDGEGDEKVTLAIVSNAQLTYTDGAITAYPSVDTYNVSADFKETNANYTLNVTDSTVQIVAKAVSVVTKLDGNSSYTTNISFTGLQHVLTGTYKDVFNASCDATVKYYSDSACSTLVSEEGVTSIGTYYAKLTIADENYKVSNTGYIIQFSIIKGYLNLNLANQTAEYSSQNIKYSIITTTEISTDYYDNDDFIIEYYKVTNEVVDLTTAYTTVSAVGKYLVSISISGNSYFFDREYDDTYLTITKAETAMTANTIEVSYDTENHTYDLLTGDISVKGVTSNTAVIGVSSGDSVVYYSYATGIAVSTLLSNTSVFEIYYYNTSTRKYVLIDEDNKGLFSAVGSYDFKLSFLGDDSFAACTLIVTMTISPAKFTGITFENKTVNVEKDTAYSISIDDSTGSALAGYLAMGAVLTYSYGSVDRVYGAEGFEYFEFTAVGSYIIYVTLTLDNYSTYSSFATLTIDKTAMTGILPGTDGNFVYDGTWHFATFTGFDLENGVLKAVYDSTYKTMILTVYYGGIQVSVSYDDDAMGINVGDYNGTITFSCSEYADFTIDTQFSIVKEEVKNVNFDMLEEYISQINSSFNMSTLGATFVDASGKTATCTFEYYQDGQKVSLNSDGTLPAGTYTIKVVFPDGNYYSNQTATITISETSGGSTTKPPTSTDDGFDIMAFIQEYLIYIAIGAGAIVVVIIIAIVVASSKKKKRKNKRNRRSGGGGSGKSKGSSNKQRPIDKPKQTKAAKDISSKDKATF